MGSPLSPIIANMVMEEIEQTAFNTNLKKLLSSWIRCEDDTEIKSFHNYLNTITTSIKFIKALEKLGTITLFGCKSTTVESWIP